MFELVSELQNIIMITDNQALGEREIDRQTNEQTDRQGGYRENSSTIDAVVMLLRCASAAEWARLVLTDSAGAARSTGTGGPVAACALEAFAHQVVAPEHIHNID